MQFTPRFIIFLAVSNYLNEREIESLKKELGEAPIKGDMTFLKIIRKHFDFEKFVYSPMIWQDIWLYNYIHLETKNKLKAKGLILRYEKDVITPQRTILIKFKELIKTLS